MEKVLYDGSTIISNVKKAIKEMISYFWQPSMERNYSSESKREIKYERPRKEVNVKENLSLDNIKMLKVDDCYMITMLGLRQDNCDERVLLRNSQREMTVIEKCLQDNLELERKAITNYMPSDYIEIYNEALNTSRYEVCLTMLNGIESHINSVSKERNDLIKKLKKGGK